MKTPHEKYRLSILLSISSTISSTACSVECDLFFILIDVLIPFVIHGFASCLILRLDKILTGAWLFTTEFNFL